MTVIFPQDSTPMRTRSLHYVNTPGIFDAVFAIAKVFMKKKILGRVKIHKNFQSLHKVIPPQYLPKEYGGTAGTLQDFTDIAETEICAMKEYLKLEEQYKVDEAKRRGNSKQQEECLFELKGSFQNLEID